MVKFDKKHRISAACREDVYKRQDIHLLLWRQLHGEYSGNRTQLCIKSNEGCNDNRGRHHDLSLIHILCHKKLYTKITAKAADGTTKTAYFTEDSALENGYVEAIQTLDVYERQGSQVLCR